LTAATSETPRTRLLIIGGGGGGAQVLDLVSRLPAYEPVAIVDNDPTLTGSDVMGVPILGRVSESARLWAEGAFDAAAMAIVADVGYRRDCFLELRSQGMSFPNLIDPSALVCAGVTLGEGNVLRPFSQISACARLGDNNYLAEYVSIGHHAEIGSHCTFLPHASTSGWVKLGSGVQCGVGVLTAGHLRVGDDSIIEAGTVLVEDVPSGSVVKTAKNYVIAKRDAGG
jgi:UDP-perosamine 4-acetyltransferase